jgi:hypothetical protein
MPSLEHLIGTFFDTVWDVMPIVVILLFFQVVVIRRLPSHLKRLLTGFVLVVVGLAFFLVGLEQALFPLGETMAQQLTAADFTGQDPTAEVDWTRYIWVYAFAAAIGFATTVAGIRPGAERLGPASGGGLRRCRRRLLGYLADRYRYALALLHHGRLSDRHPANLAGQPLDHTAGL